MPDDVLVTFAEGVLKALIGKLGNVLLTEIQLFNGVEAEVEKLVDELDGLQSFLRTIAMSPEDHNDVTRTWMKQVREMGYDAEDCIDLFLHRMRAYHDGINGHEDNEQGAVLPARNQFLNFLTTAWKQFIDALGDIKERTKDLLCKMWTCSCQCVDLLNCTLSERAKLRRRLAIKIEDLNMRAKILNERRVSYGIQVEGNRQVATTDNYYGGPNRNLPYVPADNITSQSDERRHKIIGALRIDDVSSHRVIVLFGLGGLGKTRLAKEVFEDSNIRSKYELLAFVTVSQSLNLNRLLLDLMKQLEKNSDADEQNVSQRLSKLQGKRYLIVLDDVWTVNDWEKLEPCFPRERNGSRIIITTRNEAVANACCHDNRDGIHEVVPLSEEKSKKLFWNMLGYHASDPLGASTSHTPANGGFKAQPTPPEHLKELGDNIIKKCGGMPLAIIYVAKVLAGKLQTKDEWSKFFHSMGSQLEYHPSLHGLTQIVTLSFNHLPYHLKNCLLYLSIYPEEYKIKRKNLVRRWVAEGFVTSRRGMTAEEVSESYFQELVSRSIIQRAHVGYSGKIKTCRVHDIMLEVIVSKSIEENFIKIIDEQFLGAQQPAGSAIRRLAAHYIGRKEHERVAGSLSQIRSFTAFGNVNTYISSFKFELLRVLDLEGCKGLGNDGQLEFVCKLYLLRFLSLRATDIKKIPEKVGDLTQLETLDIRQTEVKRLPDGIAKLRHLLHLLAGSKRNGPDKYNHYLISDVDMPKHFSASMESIQILSVIKMPDEKEQLEALALLKNLRKFGIWVDELTRHHNEENQQWKDRKTAFGPLEVALVDSLKELLKNLRSLTISIGYGIYVDLRFLNKIEADIPMPLQSLELRGELDTLPNWIKQLQDVNEITLCYCHLDWEESMDVLKILPNLRSLILQPLSMDTKNKKGFSVPAGFKALKTFVIDEGEYPSLKFQEASMPELEKLELSIETIKTNKEEQVLEGLREHKNLKELVLQGPYGDLFFQMVGKVKKSVSDTVLVTVITYH